jgi:hypothetical protein
LNEVGDALLQGLQSRRERRAGDSHTTEKVRGIGASDRRFPRQGPVSTSRPRAWRPPPAEWQEEARSLRGVNDLFTDGGAALQAAMGEVRDPGSETRHREVAWELYTPYAQMVLKGGYVFAVADGGEVSIVRVAKAGYTLDADELRKRAEETRWEDLELLEALRTGVVDHSDDTPKICSFARNRVGASKFAAELCGKVEAEAEEGFVRLRARPGYIPAIWRRTDMVPKPNGKLRLVLDRSALGDVMVWDGERFVPVSPNKNTRREELPELRWTSIQTVLEAGSIVADATRLAGGTVVGGTYDLKDWFRQLAVRADEVWKGGYRAGASTVEDLRLQMGGVTSASIAHRLGMLIAALLLEDLDTGLGELASRAPADMALSWAGLAAWQDARRTACGGEKGAERPYDLRNFQDDFTLQVISGLKDWADGVIRACLG